MIPGLLTILLSALTASSGLWLLSLSATRTGHRSSSFYAMSQLTYPRVAVFFDAAIAIKCFGVSVSYLIIRTPGRPSSALTEAVGSLLPRIVHTLAFDADGNGPAALVDRRVWITICVAALAPIAFLRTLHALRFTSYIALVAVVDLVFVIVFKVRATMRPRRRCSSSTARTWSRRVRSTSSTRPRASSRVCPYMIRRRAETALTPHSSPSPARRTCTRRTMSCATCVLCRLIGSARCSPAYRASPCANALTLLQNTQQRMNRVIGTSIGGAAVIYIVIGLLGCPSSHVSALTLRRHVRQPCRQQHPRLVSRRPADHNVSHRHRRARALQLPAASAPVSGQPAQDLLVR